VGVDDGMKTETPMVDISLTRFNAEDLPETELVKIRSLSKVELSAPTIHGGCEMAGFLIPAAQVKIIL